MDTKFKDKNQVRSDKTDKSRQVNSSARQEQLLKETEEMYNRGVHFGYSRSSSNPAMKKYFFGLRNNIEIFNLEKVYQALEEAESFLGELGSRKGKILFVATKPEINDLVEKAAKDLSMPYVTGRWLGGSLTNFDILQKRISYYKELKNKKDTGEFAKYIKKEASKLEKKLEKMEKNFGGLVSFTEKPDVLVVVDSKKENKAVLEAVKLNIPVVAVLNSDCNPEMINYPIPGNDTTSSSVQYFLDKVIAAYKGGTKKKIKTTKTEEKKEKVAEKK